MGDSSKVTQQVTELKSPGARPCMQAATPQPVLRKQTRGGERGRGGRVGGGKEEEGASRKKDGKPFPLVVGSRTDLKPSPLILSHSSPIFPPGPNKMGPRPCGREGLPGNVFPEARAWPRGVARPFKGHLYTGTRRRGGRRARARRRGQACLWCLEIKAANLGLFLPLTLRHFYWRDEGRQSGPTVLALLLEVNDPVSSSWLRFRHFADIKPRVSAKYILFPGAHPMHLRLLCNATKRERWLGGAAGRAGERAGAGRAGRRSGGAG